MNAFLFLHMLDARKRNRCDMVHELLLAAAALFVSQTLLNYGGSIPFSLQSLEQRREATDAFRGSPTADSFLAKNHCCSERQRPKPLYISSVVMYEREIEIDN